MNEIKLHLGCGNKKIPGFINVDIDKSVNPDIIDDVTVLEKFNNNYADLIYACHILEHMSYKETINTLAAWFKVLKGGGILRLSVPDMEAIFAHYFYWKDLTILKSLIWGSQQNHWQFHKNGWDFNSLSNKLLEIGFINIELWNWQDVEHNYIDDYSQSYYPDYCKIVKLNNGRIINLGGKLMSLNIQGQKPSDT